MNINEKNWKFIKDDLCKNSIFLTKFHQIKKDEQENITEFYTLNIKTGVYEEIKSFLNMTCEIKCLFKRNRLFIVENTVLNAYRSFWVYENLNGVRIPISVPHQKDAELVQQSIQSRLLCNYNNMIPSSGHFIMEEPMYFAQPRFEKIFGRITEYNCSAASLRIDDCDKIFLYQNNYFWSFKIFCEQPNDKDRNNIIMKNGLSKYYSIKISQNN